METIKASEVEVGDKIRFIGAVSPKVRTVENVEIDVHYPPFFTSGDPWEKAPKGYLYKKITFDLKKSEIQHELIPSMMGRDTRNFTFGHDGTIDYRFELIKKGSHRA